ncbi:low molecular weight protein-tyrosine-phosphatase [Nodularia harveyana UHCC-0300]|uniref:Low molecular weight protein-tyrosine-phosphatase n=1 Tax=Nodularia harveyana UHCC-0300 TaxID=2974287 RepID=A0ABU5UDM3_9CYAN|nr:low molecular weight protein-tyrosine-phosphatase [Nodularia harveyana]MEA5581636.1 low molecular weight protein-tyrosine-phosphatase [Nodularia harveyana UHCC-0300]
MPYKLLFVCLGNICRSPSAENIMNHLIEQAGLSDGCADTKGVRILCDSAGTSSYHIGSPPDRRMSAAAAAKLGIKLRGEGRQFQKLDFQEFDMILAMDQENYDNILALDPTGQYNDKVYLICQFCSQHTLKEVPDPYYGGVEGFNQVIDLLMDACEGLLAHITSHHLKT